MNNLWVMHKNYKNIKPVNTVKTTKNIKPTKTFMGHYGSRTCFLFWFPY